MTKEEIEMNIELKQMTIDEKLRTMEILWDDICLAVPDFSSPEWHESILKEREQRIKEGKDKFLDWEHAKRRIQDHIS